MTMDCLKPGENARIVEVDGKASFRRRLMEMGLLPGTSIENRGRAPLGLYIDRGAGARGRGPGERHSHARGKLRL